MSTRISGSKRSANEMSVVAPSESVIPVKVALRIRPLIHRELNAGSKEILEKTSNKSQVQLGQHLFTFDEVFTAESRHEDVFNGAVDELLKKGFFSGCNVTIFAYGQTGSGKTYTLGLSNIGGEAMPDGIVLRALDSIFTNVEKDKKSAEYQLTISILEIYQEKLRDLLSPESNFISSNNNNNALGIREDLGKIRVNGLSEHCVTSVYDCVKLFAKAAKRRTVGETMMNAESSRSHAIYTLTMKRWATSGNVIGQSFDTTIIGDASEPKKTKFESEKTPSYAMIDTLTCKLQIVDLAGSERCGRTQTEGSRFQEGIKINMGLLALGNVISLLGDEGMDSKLTRLLQDSLGGNSMTLMIACVSPSSDSSEETLNTLRYANRARNIKNKPVSNHQCRRGRKAELIAEIEELKRRLAEHEHNSIDRSAPSNNCPLLLKNMEPDFDRSMVMLTPARKSKAPLGENAGGYACAMHIKDLFDCIRKLLRDTHLPEKDMEKYEIICNYLDMVIGRIMGEKMLDNDGETDSAIDWSVLRSCLTEKTNVASTMTSPLPLPNLPSVRDSESDVDENSESEDEDDDENESCFEMSVAKCVQKLIDCVVTDEEIGECGVPSDIKFSNDALTEATSRKIGNLNDLLRGKEILLNQFAIGNEKLTADRTTFDATHKELNDRLRVLEQRKSDKSQIVGGAKTVEMEKLEDEIRKYKTKLEDIRMKIAENERAQEAYRLLKEEIQELKQERVLLVRELRRCVSQIQKIRLETEKKKGRLRLESMKNQSKLTALRMEQTKKEQLIDRKKTEIFSTFMKLRAILDKKKQRERERVEEIRQSEHSANAKRLCDWFDGEIEYFVNVAHANRRLEELWKARQSLNDRLLAENSDSDAHNISRSILDQLEEYSDEIVSQQQLVDRAGDMSDRMHRNLCRIRGLKESQIIFRHVFGVLVNKVLHEREMTEENNRLDEEVTMLRKQNDQSRAAREELECKCKLMLSEFMDKILMKSLDKPEILEKALAHALGKSEETNDLDDSFATIIPPTLSQSRIDILKHVLKTVRRFVRFKEREKVRSEQTPQRIYSTSITILNRNEVRPCLTPMAAPSGLPPFAHRLRKEILDNMSSSLLLDKSNANESQQKNTEHFDKSKKHIGQSPD